MRTFAASEFRAKCLGLLDDVQATGETIVITKHGRPVARLIADLPVRDDRPLGGMILTDNEEELFSTGEAWLDVTELPE